MEIQFSWFLPYESDDIRAKLENVLEEYTSSHDNESTLDLEYQNGKWFIYLNS